MCALSAAIDPAKMNKTMMEFARENEKMDMKQEMMDEALDSLFDDDTLQDEADAVTQVNVKSNSINENT